MKLLNISPLMIRILGLVLILASPVAIAAEGLKPFVLAATIDDKTLAEAGSEIEAKLQKAGFDVIGQYSPYENTVILVFTSMELRELATRSKRGGYGAALRVSLTRNDNRIELAYTNPLYWANAYRMQADAASIADFGSGDLSLSASDLRKYHYTFMMEYFDDPSVLNYFDSHQQAVASVRENLARQVASSNQVFELRLGNDINQVPMTLFGVGLSGVDADDCSGDAYIMGRIDKDSPRHSAHLPYEILVYGNQVEALYGRFRIALSWPHLPMIASDTGATFFSIMCAPGAEKALTEVAGGSRKKSGSEK
jgi:hypothetical protein